ncbi:hypothetical protein BDN72DRAFT_841141 [Pluteus cervinus]|uniref:Uncharacterized protein n=1 Tax=Pluteus cervinus TaxID=181527 RepID=A0ACD3ATI4_9AGAR|nr:hypothetical protein BDN72DRAFT_841141 [Pluteus cervinus]
MGDLLDLLDTAMPSGVEGQLQDLIIGAQKGLIKELSVLARVHGSLPDPLTGQIHLIFLNHLNSSEVPTKHKSNTGGLDEERAFWSLWGLAQLAGRLFQSSSPDLYGQAFVEAWPGVFKWSAYLYTSRVQTCGKDRGTNATSRQSRVTRDVIIGSWCAVWLNESAKRAMSKTRGVVDIAARLWISEFDTGVTGTTPFCDGVPTISCLLKIIRGGRKDDEAALDGLISAAGGDIGLIAQTACSRLKRAIKSPRFVDEPQAFDDVCVFMFFSGVCLSKPNFHEAFLNHGAIPICIKFLLWIASVTIQELRDPEYRTDFVFMMKFAFLFLWRSLETAVGVPRVLEAINSGLLTAFVECSPLYGDLPDDEYDVLSSPITVTIPRYLTYFCVVQAMDKTFLQLEKTAQFLSLRKTRAWDAFNGLTASTSWRWALVGQFKQMEREITICYSPECQKSDPRNKFRKCAKCGLALYCSKECQTVHWREFGHKRVCREPSKAYNGLQGDGNITVRDWEFIQSLNICETRYNLPYLRRLASTKHPGVPLDDLSIVVDYTAVPTAYYVTLSSRLRDHSKSIVGGRNYYMPNAEAISGTHIVGVVPYSGTRGPKICSMPFEEGVWDLDHNLTMMDGSKARVDPTGNKVIDWMCEEAEARAKLYFDI